MVGLYQGEGRDEAHSSPDVVEGFGDPAGYHGPGGPARKEEGLKRTAFFAELLNKAGQCTVVDDIQPKRYEKVLKIGRASCRERVS